MLKRTDKGRPKTARPIWQPWISPKKRPAPPPLFKTPSNFSHPPKTGGAQICQKELWASNLHVRIFRTFFYQHYFTFPSISLTSSSSYLSLFIPISSGSWMRTSLATLLIICSATSICQFTNLSCWACNLPPVIYKIKLTAVPLPSCGSIFEGGVLKREEKSLKQS